MNGIEQSSSASVEGVIKDNGEGDGVIGERDGLSFGRSMYWKGIRWI